MQLIGTLLPAIAFHTYGNGAPLNNGMEVQFAALEVDWLGGTLTLWRSEPRVLAPDGTNVN